MLSKQQIIRSIRSIHRNGGPLNITAIKRRHPELIQAVYAVKPFWGWKQALKDAGIDYRNIKIKLLDYCRCALCGKDYANLSVHVAVKHQVPCDEYLMDYPGDLHSEELRAQKLGSDNMPIRHWEPLWSKEYVLDRIAEYHRQGISVNSCEIQRVDNTLHLAAIRLCGGWRISLLTVGIDPDELTRQAYDLRHHYLDKQSVIEGIKNRHRKGWRLSHNALFGQGKTKHSDAALFNRGIELFGSWGNALLAAGIDPRPVQQSGSKKQKYPSPVKVLRELRARLKRKWAVNFSATHAGPHADAALVESGNAYFGSWNATLRAVGIDPKILYLEMKRRRRHYPDKKAVLTAMAKRIKAGRHMNFAETWKGKYGDSSLVSNAIEYFGSWDNALKAAGLHPAKIRHDALARAYHWTKK